MRLPIIAYLYLICLTIASEPAGAQEPGKNQKDAPADGVIVAMAQQFVLAQLKLRPETHFSVAFDIANIHPQPGVDYWAVVGGFMSRSGGPGYKPHAFGIAMRLICADFEKMTCWRMEKLVIDQTIILNN